MSFIKPIIAMTEEIIDYYSRQATEYDHQYTHPQFQNDLRAIRNMLLEVFPGKRVYEVACGTGRWTEYLAKVATTVYAIDRNESMLEIARKRDYPLGSVTFVRADAYSPNLSDIKFDGGLVGFWLSHVDLAKMEEFLTAFHSWLESGAMVLMFDDIQTPDRLSANRIDKYGNRYERRTLQTGEEFEIIENFFSESALLKLIDGYGTNLHYETLEGKWILRYFVR